MIREVLYLAMFYNISATQVFIKSHREGRAPGINLRRELTTSLHFSGEASICALGNACRNAYIFSGPIFKYKMHPYFVMSRPSAKCPGDTEWLVYKLVEESIPL